MKNNKREMLLTSLVCLLPLFAGAALYPRLPETMATHWDFSGNANGWASRAATVFGLPLFILALHLVCFYAESRETKKNRNPVLRTVLLWFCPAVSLLGGAVTLGTGLGYEMHISTVVPVFVGLLFLILGNYLPKIRQNRTMGIKLPWTLQGKLDPDPPIERPFVGAVRSCDDPPLPAAAVERLAVWGAAGGDGSDPCRLFLRASQKRHLTQNKSENPLRNGCVHFAGGVSCCFCVDPDVTQRTAGRCIPGRATARRGSAPPAGPPVHGPFPYPGLGDHGCKPWPS